MKRLFLILIPPLSLILIGIAGCERKVTVQNDTGDQQLTGCFNCHNDDGRLDQAQGEWANSVHASGTNIDYTNRGGGNDCTRCHDQEGFIEFLETGSVSAPYDVVSAIGCFTCHDPHERGDMSLRTVAPVILASGATFDHGNGNLCVHCHQARSAASVITDTNFAITNSRFGPHHGPQGDMIQGTNLYTNFPGYVYATSTHRDAVRDACAGCHMGNVLTHEGYAIGGHSFNMVDEETGANMAGYCTPCHATATTTLNFTANADYDGDGTIEGYQSEVDGLVDSLKTLLVADGFLNGTTNLAIPQTYADGRKAGALWNYVTVEEDRSHGVHNYKYIVSVLKASIDYLVAHPEPVSRAALDRALESPLQ